MRRAALALVVLALVACNGDEPSNGAPTPSPTGSRSILDGDYSTTYSKDTLRTAGVPEADLCEHAGTHQLTFLGFRWALLRTPLPECGPPQRGSDSGTFAIAGDVVSFTDRNPVRGCVAEYRYRFLLGTGTLRFEGVQDDCVPRRTVMVTQPYRKTGD